MSEDYYASLSDAQLRGILRERKIKCGPITQSTRHMYVTKLVRLDEGTPLNSSSDTNNNNNTNNSSLHSSYKRKSPRKVKNDQLHSTPIAITSVTPPVRRSFIQYTGQYNNSNHVDINQSDPNIIEFSPYSNSRHANIEMASPGHTPFVGGNKRKSLIRNPNHHVSSVQGQYIDATIAPSPSSMVQTDFPATNKIKYHQLYRHITYIPTSEPSSDNTSNNHSSDNTSNHNNHNHSNNSSRHRNSVERRRTGSGGGLRRRYHRNSSVQTDEVNNSIVGVVDDSRLVSPNSHSNFFNFNSLFSIWNIFLYGLGFLSLYLISHGCIHWIKYSFNTPKENNLEKCIITTLQHKKSYGDCNSVNNYLKSINQGDTALSVSYLYSQCQHYLPKDHRLMEGFVSILKDISHENSLICYDHSLAIVDCSDNIFYVASIPTLLRRIQCGFGLFVNVENMMTLLGALGLASFCIYIRSRKLIVNSKCCTNLTKSSLFMLKRQRELFLKGFVEEMFLPIALVRDSLIPSQNRSKLNYYWTVVEDRINRNTLVSCETIQISGVSTKCWKLLSVTDAENYSLEDLTFIPTKRWYPSVNDVKKDTTHTLVTNQITSAPTSYVKIFNAHVAEQEIIPKWDKLLVDAVVERCNYAGAIVIHCKVDAANIEGVVYLRTVDENSAAIVYNTINSMWLDGNQLTCKFLQRDQYLRKFPECVNSYDGGVGGVIKKDPSIPTSLN